MKRKTCPELWRRVFLALLILGLLVVALASVTNAQGPTPRAPRTTLGTGFTYQGQLKQSGSTYTGSCDFVFSLWDSLGIINQIGSSQTKTNVTVTNGLFTIPDLDFGSGAFNGDTRYLAISVRCPGGSGLYTMLTPRQELTPAPYALTAMKTAYKNVLVVAKSGGHYNTITAALNSITDASTTNRYLIWVAPGTYNETVTMKQYVDIEGSGELTTKITYTGNANATTGTVIGASNAELRLLTVESTGSNLFAIAIYNSSASPRLTHITANASGVAEFNIGVLNESSSSPTMTNVTATASGGTNYNRGVNNQSSSPMMTNVTATASGAGLNSGVFNSLNSYPTMTNVTATASAVVWAYGVYNDSSSMTIQNSTISASGATYNYGIFNNNSGGTYTVKINISQITGSTNTIANDGGFTTRIGASKLDGGAVSAGGGTLTCVFTYDENYVALNSVCQ
jgi:hypothetical protein